MDELTLRAPAISCGHCARTIQEELTAIPGICAVEVDVESKRVQVRFETPVTAEVIEAALADLGFPVEKPT